MLIGGRGDSAKSVPACNGGEGGSAVSVRMYAIIFFHRFVTK